jgi:hypothetical protein
MNAAEVQDGSLAEIIVNDSGRATSAVEVLARDTAVAASLCFQIGCDVETLQGAPMRHLHGCASGPVGKLLGLLASEDG